MSDNDLAVTVLESDDVAKKKADEKKAKPTQDILLVYKADSETAPEFRRWMTGLADHMGISVTSTIDVALKRLAIQEKYEPIPKRRKR